VIGTNLTQPNYSNCLLCGSADKSLARQGMKQATATKLGIYSTYIPRSSIHFLGRCYNFCEQPKKILTFVSPSRSPRQDWPTCRKENCELSLVFQSKEQAVAGRRIWWVINTLEAQVGLFLLGCKWPVSRVIIVQDQELLGDLPAVFCLQNISIAPAETSKTRRW